MVNTILTVVFVIISVVLSIIVLMQEGKSAGLGAISGSADTYWSKNKGRSMEGTLNKATRILAVLFMLIAILLNSKFIYTYLSHTRLVVRYFLTLLMTDFRKKGIIIV